jgi:hypothetical protein
MKNEINLNEEFGHEIYQTVIKYNLKNNLEIGSWDGEGSTECFVEAMKNLTGDKFLGCVEIDKDKILKLDQKYKNINFVNPIYASSISYKELLYKDFEDVWNSPYNKIRKDIYSKELVKNWFDKDINILKNVKKSVLSDLFTKKKWDSVLIDGGEFTGYSEYQLLKEKTKIFFLDDVHHAFKCYQIYEELKTDFENWELLKENENIRNGYAIFKRK